MPKAKVPMAAKAKQHQTDRELVARVIEIGDEAAFRELYGRHTGRVYAMMLRLLESEHDAEDVVQETWTRAMVAAHRFRWESSFSSWLTAIALNCARGMRRQSRRWQLTDLPEEASARSEWGATDARIDVERALDRVPAGYRAVLTLYELEGHSHEEVGQRLGIAPGTSKSQLHHARRFVRNLMEPCAAEATA